MHHAKQVQPQRIAALFPKPTATEISSTPWTWMLGGSENDTYVYRNYDYISDSTIGGWGWSVVPDFTYSSGWNAGMHQVSE